MVNILLLWFGSGLFGLIIMTIQAKLRGHDISHIYKKPDFKFIIILIGGGLITLSVAADKVTKEKK